MASTVVPTTANQIILAVIAQLQSDATNFTPDTVFCWQGEVEPSFDPLGDFYVMVGMGDGGPVEPWVDGMGRIATKVTRRLSVTVRSRLALDEANRDLSFLTGQATDGSLAHLTREHAVMNDLAGFQPLSADGANNWIVTEPMRMAPNGISRPMKSRERKEWGSSKIEFDVCFILAFDQSYQ